MKDIEVIEDPRIAEVSLDPMRSRILEALVEPASAATVAGRIGAPRQKVNYHLKALESAGLVELVEERRHLHPLTYTADGFVALLGTFSDNLALPLEQRDELFRRIHARIAARPNGTVTEHHLLVLTVGRV